MDGRLLVILVVLAHALSSSSSEVTPRICMKEGGLGCRCTTLLSEMVLPRCDVDCSARNISALPSKWEILQGTRRLDLSRNLLSTLSAEQFSHWGNLEELNLSRNRFVTLNKDAFVGLANLQMLDLSFNALTTLAPSLLNGLPNLRSLNLEMNRLGQLSPGLFGPTPHLQALTLSYNLEMGRHLARSAEALVGLLRNNLTSLTMNNMSIESLPSDLFNEGTALTFVSLADNPLTIVDILPPSLESLNLSGADIAAIAPGGFIYFPNLKSLHLDRLLQLVRVDSYAFQGLEALQELSMDNCIQLHHLHPLAFEGVPLRRLSLARSGLHTLDPEVFAPTLQQVDLQGNPWQCDCRLSWFKRRNFNFSLVNRGYLRCFGPERHHNKLILSLPEEEFTCSVPDRNGLSMALDASLVIVVLVVCSAILGALWRRDFIDCRRRHQTVGTYSHVSIEPNRAELEWDNKDLEHIWTTTPPSK